MADEVDQATALIEARLANTLAARKDTSALPSLSECRACGEPIHPKRQALGGVVFCVECQRDDEHRRRLYR